MAIQENQDRDFLKFCPFYNKGKIEFSLRPLRDIAFIWAQPQPVTLGKRRLIELPEQFRSDYRAGLGILLAAGPGYFGRDARIRVNGRWVEPKRKDSWHPTSDQLIPGRVVQYDVTVPWYTFAKNHLGNNHLVVMCGVSDIYGVYEE